MLAPMTQVFFRHIANGQIHSTVNRPVWYPSANLQNLISGSNVLSNG